MVSEAVLPQTLALHGNLDLGVTRDEMSPPPVTEIKSFDFLQREELTTATGICRIFNGSRYCRCTRHESAVTRVTCLGFDSGFDHHGDVEQLEASRGTGDRPGIDFVVLVLSVSDRYLHLWYSRSRYS